MPIRFDLPARRAQEFGCVSISRRYYSINLGQAEDSKYLGKDDGFDHSVTDFSERYADQNERDYKAFSKAIRSERLTAVEGV